MVIIPVAVKMPFATKKCFLGLKNTFSLLIRDKMALIVLAADEMTPYYLEAEKSNLKSCEEKNRG